MKIMRLTESLGTIAVGEIDSKQRSRILDEAKKKKPDDEEVAVYPKIEAIHAGLTNNKTFYAVERLKGNKELKSGVFSWLVPYRKPMLTHHNKYDGEPIGRIVNAQFVRETQAGKEGIVVIPKITDPEAIEKVLDGRYFTVSIGAETDAAVCSICGVNRAEEWCDHQRGQKYEDKECYWIIGNLWFSELSFVNVPADRDAMIVDISVSGMEEFEDGEHVFTLNESNTLYAPPPEILTYEQSLSSEGIDIESLYNTAKAYKSRGTNTEKEVNDRWDEIVASAKKGDDGKKEVNKVTFEDLLKQVREMEEDARAEFTLKETDDPVELKVQLTLLKEGATSTLEENTSLKEQVKTLTSEKETLETDKTALEEAKADSDNKVKDLEEQNKTLQTTVTDAEAENTTLSEENATLHAELHKNLAERVVDLKVALGKPGVKEKDKAIEAHIGRKAESLQDALADLLAEMEAGYHRVSPGIAQPPGAATGKQKGAIKDTKPSKETKESSNGKKKAETDADVVRAMLTRNKKSN